MKKRDVLWGGALAILFLAGCIWWFLWGRTQGAFAVIRQDGEILYRLPLTVPREITVEGEGGRNTIQISPEGIRVTKADCPDGLCQKQGLVQKTGTPIVCLPHRLTVEIEGGGQ